MNDSQCVPAPLWRRFLAQARTTPGGTAYVLDQGIICYEQLLDDVGRIAAALEALPLPPGQCVALYADVTPATIAAILAINRIGATYLPIDAHVPSGRCLEISRRAGAAAILHTGTFDAVAHAGGFDLTPLATLPAAPDGHPAGPCPLAILSTSGTTGTPRLVVVSDAAAMSRLDWMWRRFPVVHGDIAIVHRPISILGFFWDCFGALLRGTPSYVAAPTCSPLERLRRGILDHHGTTASAAPSLWSAVVEHVESTGDRAPGLRLAFSAGEPLPTALAERFRAAFPHSGLVNVYGATECQTPLAYDVPHGGGAAGRLPYVPAGTPICDAEVLVLDQALQPVGNDQVGELYVAGPGLADGYLHEPEATAERFVSIVGADRRPRRMFRTNDLARTIDGVLCVIGRADLTVNVRGHRVDPIEVETALRQVAGVESAAVAGVGDPPDTELVAFIVGSTLPSEVSTQLQQRLPAYLVPTRVVTCSSLPLTRNGKLDRRALPSLIPCEPPAAAADPGEIDVAAKVRMALEELLRNPVDLEHSLLVNGGTSLTAMRLSIKVASVWQIECDPDEFLTEAPLMRLVDRIRQRHGAVRAGDAVKVEQS